MPLTPTTPLASHSPLGRRTLLPLLEAPPPCPASAPFTQVDIANLDAIVIVGFPGSVSSLWQRAGRCGREARSDAVCVLVAYPSPIDQACRPPHSAVLAAPAHSMPTTITARLATPVPHSSAHAPLRSRRRSTSRNYSHPSHRPRRRRSLATSPAALPAHPPSPPSRPLAPPPCLLQWVMRNPRRVLSLPPEACVVDVDNPSILDHHLLCAAAEEPISAAAGDAALFGHTRSGTPRRPNAKYSSNGPPADASPAPLFAC